MPCLLSAFRSEVLSRCLHTSLASVYLGRNFVSALVSQPEEACFPEQFVL